MTTNTVPYGKLEEGENQNQFPAPQPETAHESQIRHPQQPQSTVKFSYKHALVLASLQVQ